MAGESPEDPARGSGEQVRDAAIAAARNAFAAGSYARTTFKGLAAAAGVAPTVLRKYYDNKDAVFAAALRLPTDPVGAVPTSANVSVSPASASVAVRVPPAPARSIT